MILEKIIDVTTFRFMNPSKSLIFLCIKAIKIFKNFKKKDANSSIDDNSNKGDVFFK